MRRREFLQTAALSCWAGAEAAAFARGKALPYEWSAAPAAASVIPVVGDGRWIWTKPPEGATGYLEPRRFRLRVGIELTGRGDAGEITASTPVPVVAPEQEILSEKIDVVGSEAVLETFAPDARMLRMAAPGLVRGGQASAIAEFELKLSKQYFGYAAEQFPEKQTVAADVRRAYLGDSPGIQTRAPNVQSLLQQLIGRRTGSLAHPWRQAEVFAAWIRAEIRPKLGIYTSVVKAIENRSGDCEEMAGVFVALCRAAEIPARLVWIPNHVWSEFYLVDHEGRGHWIPVHTACYHWFGWTGAHELVFQKGDRLRVPGKGTLERLQQDRLRWAGTKPEASFWAELTPLADGDEPDAGPGARRKSPTGEWLPIGTHAQDAGVRR